MSRTNNPARQGSAAALERRKRGTLGEFLNNHPGNNNGVATSKVNGIGYRPNTAVISAADLKNIRATLGNGTYNKGQVSVVSQSDLARIRNEVIIKDKTTLHQEYTMMGEQKQKQMATAQARKQRMQAQDRERQAKAPLTVKMAVFGDNSLLAGAQQQMDEGYDDVKAINALVVASKVMTVRDRQLQENTLLEQNWVEEQKRLDMMMEIERLKAIQAEMDRENRAAAARKRGAQVLIDQIADRQVYRQKEEEILEVEKALLQANIEKQVKEEADKKAEKMARVQVRNEEVKIANANQKKQKAAAIENERRLDREIAQYSKNKVEREEAKAREDARLKDEKEREIQRLRDLQERANDRAAAMDAIKAKKAFEEAELAIRAKEAAKKASHDAKLQDLHQDRQRQFAANDARMKSDAQVERERFLATVALQKQLEEEEKLQNAIRQGAFNQYKVNLTSQMAQNDVQRQNEKHQIMVDGKKNRLFIDQERNRIEIIKAQKLSGVKDLGVADKYTQELLRKKASF